MPYRGSPRWPAGAIVVLTIAAPFLGGSTKLWAQTVIALAASSIFLMAPPRKSLGLGMNLLFVGFAILPLTEFLPANIFPAPAWRTTLTGFGIHLPNTVSPQPWITIQSACLLWLGLAWAYYLFSYDWDTNDSRENVWDGYCLGILGLAALLVTAYALKWRVPFWPNVPEFGFFPNRNQTSNVLSLGGIIIYANAFNNLERDRRRGWLWLGGLGLICWALILNYSRSGIILFFAGALAWHIWWLTTRDRTEAIPQTIAWGPLAILLALLLFAGGETLVRLKQSTDFFSTSENGRLLIQQDAFHLFQKSPLLGIGLGNFRSLFSAHRQLFVSDSEAIHPESDWLWVATEMGLLAPLLLAAGFVLWFWRCFPLELGTLRSMRRAAIICVIAFAVHGLFDVSGHRVGSMWPALLLAATALHPQVGRPARALLPFFFRAAGLGFIAIAAWWFGSSLNGSGPPSTATVQRVSTQIAAATEAGQYDRLLSLAEKGLDAAPLRWSFYYDRGLAEAFLNLPRGEILRHFAVARFLMPNWPNLYLKEGAVLLNIDETDAAFDIWKEGMERLSTPQAFYSDMYPLVNDDPDLRERWRQLGQPNQSCILIFLQNATSAEFQIELNRIVAEDPELGQFTPAQLKILFAIWYRHGEKLSLAETLRAHPEWQQIGWRELSLIYADYQDYHQAYDILVRFAGVQLPAVSPNESIDSLAIRFRRAGGEGDGLQLARVEAQHGLVDDALAVITVLSSRPRPSPLVRCVEAELWARKQDWAKAWRAMWQYIQEAKK
ncbi:MAG TPA: O-antigen ligase family protein [Chthoniobacterales bacterium]